MSRPSDPNARIKLLTAAEQIFGARGLDGAKVEDIAERAGLAKGSFYLHFDSKEDAFRELVEAMVARMAAHLDGLPDDCAAPGCGVLEFLDQWVSQDLEIFEFIWQNRRLMGLLLEGGRCSTYRHLVDQFLDRAVDKSRTLLAAGVSAGLYREDLDLDVAASFIAGSYDRLARDLVTAAKRPDIESRLRQLQVLILRGVGSASLIAEMTARVSAKDGKRAVP